jgi:hypothetical protein
MHKPRRTNQTKAQNIPRCTKQRASLPYGAPITLLIAAVLGIGIFQPVFGALSPKQRTKLTTIHLGRCEKRTYTRALPLGSVRVEVTGRRGNACSLVVTDEVEMGVNTFRCSYPTRKGKLVIWTGKEAGVSFDGQQRHCVRSESSLTP